MNGKVDKIKARINEIKREKEELRQKHDYIIEQVKKASDANAKDVQFLKNEVTGIQNRLERKDESMTGMRSFMNSLDKKLSVLESRHAAMKERMEEEMKIAERELGSELNEKAKAINLNMSAQLRESLSKSLRDVQAVKDALKKAEERNGEHDTDISRLIAERNNISKALSELEGRNDAIKNTISEKISAIEKAMMTEIANAKALEARLDKDVKDFEKFASGQKSRMAEFEASVLGKIDMFALNRENLKRDFASLSTDFKNLLAHIDSIKEKYAFVENRLKNAELGLENFKKSSDELFAELRSEQKGFREDIVAKLNEANEKIVGRLAQDESKSASEIAKQADEIKVFRAHMTQFINDFVNNYEKRFEKMKSDMDQALGTMEQHAKEQARQPRAVIFE